MGLADQAHTGGSVWSRAARTRGRRRVGVARKKKKAAISFSLCIRAVSWSPSARLRVVIAGERETDAGSRARGRLEVVEG